MYWTGFSDSNARKTCYWVVKKWNEFSKNSSRILCRYLLIFASQSRFLFSLQNFGAIMHFSLEWDSNYIYYMPFKNKKRESYFHQWSLYWVHLSDVFRYDSERCFPLGPSWKFYRHTEVERMSFTHVTKDIAPTM